MWKCIPLSHCTEMQLALQTRALLYRSVQDRIGLRRLQVHYERLIVHT